MRLEKSILAVFVFAFVFSLAEIYAQDSKSLKHFSISKHNKSTPFKEGETVIAEVKFTGLDTDYEQYGGAVGTPVYESDFRKVWREKQSAIHPDEKFDTQKVEQVIKLLKQWLASHGYIKAEVVALGEKLAQNRMTLLFEVKRGEIIRVAEIRFLGNRNIANEEYIANLKQCSGDGWETFEKRKYEYYTQKCSRELMLSKGFFSGKIKSVAPQIERNYYFITIEVEEGIRYQIGEIKIEGAKAFTKKELLEMLDLKTGDIVDGKLIREFFFEKLKQFYADKGYIQYNCEFDVEFVKPQVEGLDGIINIRGIIEEGKSFKIGKIEWVGIEEKSAKELEDFLSLKEGGIFIQSKLEEGIKKIGNTKKFQPIDINRDVEFWTDEDSGELGIVIKLRKIE